MAHIVHNARIRSHIAAEARKGFAECAHDDINLIRKAEMFRSAAPVRAEHAKTVRIIHHDACAVLLGKADDLRQVADVAAHAEHAIGHNQPACGFGDALQLFSRSAMSLWR